MGHEGGEWGAVFGGDIVEAAVDGVAEFGEVFVVATVQHVAFDELPEAFDQVQVWGVRRQEQELDVERGCEGLHHSAVLIASVVENQGDWSLQSQRGDLAQQVAHRVRRHGPGGGDADQFVGHGVPGSQHAVALATGRTANEQPTQAPEATQERALHKVRGIDKEEVPLTGAGCGELRFQLLIEEFRLSGRMLLDGFLRWQRDGCRTTPLQAQSFFKKRRT